MTAIILTLIAVFLLYVVPEMLKPRRSQEYKYPEIPDSVPPPVAKHKYEVIPPPLPGKPATFVKEPAQVTQDPTVQTAYDLHLPVAPKMVISANSEASAWDGKLTSAAVLNGVIFAEILQPPKALRHGCFPGRR